VVAIGPVLALAGRANTPSAAGVTTTEASAQKLRLSKESRGANLRRRCTPCAHVTKAAARILIAFSGTLHSKQLPGG
jgi:hypothetical protein